MAKKTSNTAQSASYKLDVRRGVEVIIQFDFTAFDDAGNEYGYSLRDFDEDPKLLRDILAAIAKTWPAKDGIKFRYDAQATGVGKIVEIL